MADTTRIVTPDHVTLELELAGLGTRISAACIDLLLQILFVVLLLFLLGLAGLSGLSEEKGASWLLAVAVLGFFLTTWGYGTFWESLARGQTPGKMVMGIRVLREDGLPIGPREAALRNLARAADMWPPPFFVVGSVVLHFHPRSQRLGDLLAGTLVVRERFERTLLTRVGAVWSSRVERGKSRQGLVLPRGEVSAERLGLLEQYLARAGALPMDRRMKLAWELARPLLPLLGLEEGAFRGRPDQLEACERVLAQVLELAETEGEGASLAQVESGGALF